MPQNNGRTWTAFVPLVTAVLYGASPIDLIPDLLLLVGWVDDGLMAFAMGLMSLWMFVRARRRALYADGPVPPYLPVRS
ncbi:MAG: DUF1232 domain-containing protein [Fimbriimonadaceae bacterium]